jgi:hypothetical protein
VLLLLGGGLAGAAQPRSQTTPKGRAGSSATAISGKLKIFVPVGMVGDDFWIYLNGHLVSSPPHGTPAPGSHDFIQVPLHKGGINGPANGWEIWGTEGRYLGMSNETFSGLDGFVKSGRSAVQQLFQPVELALDPANYTLDLVISSPGNSYAGSFPFVVTRKYEMSVRRGATEQVYIAVPDNWNGLDLTRALPVNKVCPRAIAGGRPEAPDLDQLQRWITDYDNDSMVHVLQRGVATRGSRAKKVVVLDLPPSQGGSREFENRQIRDIVAALEDHHSLPTHEEVKQCMEKLPQFTRTYTEYDRLLTDLDQEIESFRKLAGN